jgi:ubiquinone/menaquinone biosynthesis C-methylase UbiE
MDAGGGTGRWSIKILEHMKDSHGTICDISDEMMSVAKRKRDDKGLTKRLNIIKCNIEDMKTQESDKYDMVMNLHNVLAFTENSQKAILEISRVLKKDGIALSAVPNTYHALYFNISIGRLHDIEKIANIHIGRFADSMPNISMFTPSSIKALYENAGLKNVRVLGFPVTVYPGTEETKISGNSVSVDRTLGNKKTFDMIFELEKKLVMNEEAASRGNNLFVIGVK